MSLRKVVIACIIFIWLGVNQVFASDPHDSIKIYEQSEQYLFATEAPLEFTVRCKLDKLISDIEDDRTWHIGSLSYLESGKEKQMPIRLRTRGNFRRKRKTCSFPPIKFDFPNESETPTIFNKLSRLKFVTHCRSKEKYEQNILIEYLIYKLYNIFTEESYRVRLAKVKWIDSEGKEETHEKWGFFIENTKQMAKRLKGRIINIPNVHQDKTHYNKIARLAIFQYMIGNTDWGVSTLHNIRLLMRDPYQPPIPVPYDFDWSGIINAPYATPLPEFEINSVKDRVYRGFYRNEKELNKLKAEFINQRSTIYKIVEEFELLTPEKKIQVVEYLDSFFQIIENQKMMKYEFIKNCRKDDF